MIEKLPAHQPATVLRPSAPPSSHLGDHTICSLFWDRPRENLFEIKHYVVGERGLWSQTWETQILLQLVLSCMTLRSPQSLKAASFIFLEITKTTRMQTSKGCVFRAGYSKGVRHHHLCLQRPGGGQRCGAASVWKRGASGVPDWRLLT